MLVRKDFEKAIFNNIADTQIVPVVSTYGFKYLRSKNRFEKGSKDFIQVISLWQGSLSLQTDPDQLYFTFHINISIEHKEYDKWMETAFKKKANFRHSVQSISTFSPVDIDQLSHDDFYEPTGALAFKNYVRGELTKGLTSPQYIPLDSVLLDLGNNIGQMENLCDYRKIIAAHPNPSSRPCADLLLYYKDVEGATYIYKENYENLCKGFEEERAQNSSQQSHYLDIINEYRDVGERFLNIKFEAPIQIGFHSTQTDRVVGLEAAELKYKELFTLEKPYRRIVSYAVNPITGRTIVGHDGQVATVWSSTGELLLEFNLSYPDGYEVMTEYRVGYLPEVNAFYANNYIITDDLNVYMLEIPLIKAKKDQYKIHPRLDVPIAYCDDLKTYIILFSHNRNNYAFFYNEAFKLINQLEVKFRPLEILPKRQWIAFFDYMKKIVLLDFSGTVVAELDSSNASLGLLDNKFHDISSKEDYLFSFCYNVKSTLFLLDDFSKNTLWGHTTFEKDYKELYYNDINHNFGITIGKFAPNGSYIVAGAEHGKYIAWKLPKLERVELIPNDNFLKKFPHALVYQIGNKRYLKNRGNCIRDIQFLHGGDFFTTMINDDILIWNKAFTHLSTLENIGKITPFTDEYICIEKDETLSLFRKSE